MSRRSRPMWAGTSPSAGPPTTSNCAAPRSKLLPIATTKPAASPLGTGRPRCTWRRSRCPASSPRRWREEQSADPARRPTPRRTQGSTASRLLRDVEVELDQHVVRIGHENLSARAVRHLVDAERHAFARQMLLDGVEAAAAKGDVVDDARIRPLRLVGGRNVIEMQHRMTFAVKPGAGKVEWRPRPVHQTEHFLVEANGVAQVTGRDVVVVEHTDAHAHRTSPPRLLLRVSLAGVSWSQARVDQISVKRGS